MSFKVGDKVQFHRGMFGMWPCTIKRIRQSTKRRTFGNLRVWVADVTYARKNGTSGKAVVQLEHLEPRPEATQCHHGVDRVTCAICANGGV